MSDIHVLYDQENSKSKSLVTSENHLKSISDSTEILLNHMNTALQMIYPSTQMLNSLENALEKPYRTFFSSQPHLNEEHLSNSEIESILYKLEVELEDFIYEYDEDNFVYKKSLEAFHFFKNKIPHSISKYFYPCFVDVRFNRRSYDSLNEIEKKLNRFFIDIYQTFYGLEKAQSQMQSDIDYIRSECFDFQNVPDDEIGGTFEEVQEILDCMEDGTYATNPDWRDEESSMYYWNQ